MRYVSEHLCEPYYANHFAAGLDLRSAVDIIIQPQCMTRVSAGLAVELPPGHVGLVRGRSGMAFNRRVWVFEGTIDEDYRGQISLLLVNFGGDDVKIERGDRVAQLVIVPVARVVPTKVSSLLDTDRGTNGFGSTGSK